MHHTVPTKAHECALALAIPLTFDEFRRDLEAGSKKDFAKSVVRSPRFSAVTVSYLWEEVYFPAVNVVHSVAEEVARNGVSVFKNVSINDFRSLFSNYKTITLVAHWRDSFFLASDFTKPAEILKHIMNPSDPSEQAFVDAIPSEWIARLVSCYHDLNKTRDACQLLLAKTFNDVLQRAMLYDELSSSNGREVVQYDEAYHCYLNRKFIDTLFSAYIVPGNQIELSNKLYSVDDIYAVIPADFPGTIDFTVCNSVLIGNRLKRQRNYRVIVNEQPALLGYRMLIYKSIIELLKRTPMDYAQATVDIYKGLRG